MPEVLSARFYADGRKAGKDGDGPFDTKVGAKRLDASDKNRISANVDAARRPRVHRQALRAGRLLS